MVDHLYTNLSIQNFLCPRGNLARRNEQHDTWVGVRPDRHQHHADPRPARGRHLVLASEDLNASAKTPGVPTPTKPPRLATLGAGRAHKAFAAEGHPSAAGPVRLPSRTRTRSYRQSAAP